MTDHPTAAAGAPAGKPTAADPEAWGIARSYEDVFGRVRETPEQTVRALVRAMGGDPDRDREPPASDGVLLVRQGETHALAGPAVLHLENGTERRLDGEVPRDLPPGAHRIDPVDGAADAATVIVSPGRCVTPAARGWGLAVQLYAARSTDSWGIGDLGDLARLGRWARHLDAGAILVNPLNAAMPGPRDDPSPYRPSSRLFLDPVYLRIEAIPGADPLGERLATLGRAGRALNDHRTIDRDAVLELKWEALHALWDASPPGVDDGIERFRTDRGAVTDAWAVHAVLAEQHGRDWREWPEELRHPDSPAVVEAAEANAQRCRFHLWVQWLLDEQLREAAEAAPLVMDLPVGVAPGGFDAWLWQDVLALDASVGAPPDRLGPAGQDWEVPPLVPWKLRRAAYRPFAQTVRAALRHAAGLRIDHVLGLFRLFWIPPGGSPRGGAYVRYPVDELLDVIALESHRAGAIIVGEDLGTVGAGVRDEMTRRGMLRTQVLLFEDGPPDAWAELALAAVTTHDLPTVAGLMTGSDGRMQQSIGLDPDLDWLDEVRRRVAAQAGIDPAAPADVATVAIHRALAQVRSVLAIAQVEDLAAVEDRPNVPGTRTDVRANWSLALPRPLDHLLDDPLVGRVVEVLRARR